MRSRDENIAIEVIEAVKAQRAAHDAYCRALEERMALLEGRLEDHNGEKMLTYTFLVNRHPELIDEYAKHCLATDDDEWRRGIPLALDGLEEHSDAAMEWRKQRRR